MQAVNKFVFEVARLTEMHKSVEVSWTTDGILRGHVTIVRDDAGLSRRHHVSTAFKTVLATELPPQAAVTTARDGCSQHEYAGIDLASVKQLLSSLLPIVAVEYGLRCVAIRTRCCEVTHEFVVTPSGFIRTVGASDEKAAEDTRFAAARFAAARFADETRRNPLLRICKGLRPLRFWGHTTSREEAVEIRRKTRLRVMEQMAAWFTKYFNDEIRTNSHRLVTFIDETYIFSSGAARATITAQQAGRGEVRGILLTQFNTTHLLPLFEKAVVPGLNKLGYVCEACIGGLFVPF
jgi:hypothetical protein